MSKEQGPRAAGMRLAAIVVCRRRHRRESAKTEAIS